MVTFTKLKLYGFKSFVDKTELEIGAGLNGIVGPNGCGKSNLVEALRWVMGEKSAKNMRGSGMEDVIFAGTSKRPARNMAEVTVIMDNNYQSAPAPFNTATEIEINRRIEKDKGSQYRVNGKAVRARDVNLLFADTMTGANSPALVSQGRITEIIMAKPADRRKILEDSAGISGLHSRRHEAELRLRAAEQNLTRLDDVLAEMKTRLNSLKRQARQAERYKELSDNIRRLDMAETWQSWREIHAKIKLERDSFSLFNDHVQETLGTIKSLTSQIDDLEKSLPDDRKKNMESSAILQNFKVSLERLEQDIQSKTKGLQDAEQAKVELDADCNFTRDQYNQILNDIDDTEKQLETAKSNLASLPDDIDTAQNVYTTIKATYDNLVKQSQSLETEIAVVNQSQDALQKQKNDTDTGLERIQSNITMLGDAIGESEKRLNDIQNDDVFTLDIDSYEDTIEKLKITIQNGDDSLSKDRESEKRFHQDLQDKTASLKGIESEVTALNSMIEMASSDDDLSPEDSLLTQLNVQDGYEKAVSSVLGHWISMASIHDNSSVYWTTSTCTGTTLDNSLIQYVDVPDVLKPLINSISVVDDIMNIGFDLSMGQTAVALDGSFRRWDGLIVKSEAANKNNQAGLILEQKNRVQILETQQQELKTVIDELTVKHTEIQSKIEVLEDQQHESQSQLNEKNNFVTEHRYKMERLNDQVQAITEKLEDQNQRLSSNESEKQNLEQSRNDIIDKLSSSDSSSLQDKADKLDVLHDDIKLKRDDLDDAQHKLVVLRQSEQTEQLQTQTFTNTLNKLCVDRDNLSKRQDDLIARLDAVDTKITAYKASQSFEETDVLREDLLTKISNQESEMQNISTSLEIKEKSYRDLQMELRNAEGDAATNREKRALAQANVANAQEDLSRVEGDIAERFELTPQSLEEKIYSLFDSGIPELDKIHDEKEIIVRQRDGIGPVNLRAAIESQETETQLAEMETEHNDLTKAIEQLRSGIAKLNREAKERLAIAFTRVDGHFQKLFATLFEGGRAYLEMLESDDPLEAGLEIYAQPPGKSLQKLSLLSGGEQTLTATALIFAMFMTNPSPICVLDEIDAPLDDANVDRVCSLMEKIVTETETRFIVITHHRMTMARMDRLYGVTMGERGVSQLVSVDMALQEEMELSESA
jgi:chromosome segregation protein